MQLSQSRSLKESWGECRRGSAQTSDLVRYWMLEPAIELYRSSPELITS